MKREIDIDFIRDQYPNMTAKELGAMFGMTERQMIWFCYKNGISKSNKWTLGKIKELKLMYAVKSRKEVAKNYGLTVTGLRSTLYRFGIKKSHCMAYRKRQINKGMV